MVRRPPRPHRDRSTPPRSDTPSPKLLAGAAKKARSPLLDANHARGECHQSVQAARLPVRRGVLQEQDSILLRERSLLHLAEPGDQRLQTGRIHEVETAKVDDDLLNG